MSPRIVAISEAVLCQVGPPAVSRVAEAPRAGRNSATFHAVRSPRPTIALEYFNGARASLHAARSDITQAHIPSRARLARGSLHADDLIERRAVTRRAITHAVSAVRAGRVGAVTDKLAVELGATTPAKLASSAVVVALPPRHLLLVELGEVDGSLVSDVVPTGWAQEPSILEGPYKVVLAVVPLLATTALPLPHRVRHTS